MINYDKDEVKEQLTQENVFQLFDDLGGEPEYTPFGIVAGTICHNHPGEGSHKLYWYKNTGLCRCFTGCDETFDVFDLYRRAEKVQKNEDIDLNAAVRSIAARFGIDGTYKADDNENLKDWEVLSNYKRIDELELKQIEKMVLPEYDKIILDRFNYSVKIKPWLDEDINQEVLDYARIGFYPGNDQITIPHWDSDNRFIGLRGRTLSKEDAEKYGKYRPIRVNRVQYSHPLGYNLYGYNWAKDNIAKMKIAIVVESEKSVLKYMSYFGIENNIVVACCGSSISSYQIKMLTEAGAREIVVAFDRQFQEINDDEFNHLTTNLLRIRDKYKSIVNISFIFDKNMITGYKDAPLDCGPEIFLQLFKERIVL